MSGESRSSSKHTISSKASPTRSPAAATPRRPQHLHRAASSQSAASPKQTYHCVYHISSSSSRPSTPNTRPSKPSPLSTMTSQQSQAYYSPHSGSPYYLQPNMQTLDASQQYADMQSQPWMMATMIEDDDLTFGGKSLSDWYEEDRRRLSLGDDSAPSPDSWRDEEEERRGRQRQRPSYQTSKDHGHHHKHHHKKSDKKH